MPTIDIDIESLYKLYLQHPSITTDSRQIEEGQIFFALKGDRYDGNKFARQAIEQGAAYAIISDRSLLSQSEKMRWVPDTLLALQKLAKWHRKQLTIPIVGITGTNGKTTTKELTKRVLTTHYNTFATKGNLNNHIGVPLSILSIKPTHEIAIIEMGASSIGEIAFLCEIACPTHGIVTNIGKAHLEGFGSVEGILQAKGELPYFIYQHGGKFFLNIDDQLLHQEWKNKNHIGYSTKSGEGNVTGEVLRGFPFLDMSITHQGERYQLKSQMVGAYNASNVLAALTIGLHFDILLPDAIKAIANYHPDNNRSEMKEIRNGVQLIADAYNANPSSMYSALESFEKARIKHKIAILGDMLELGSYTQEEHDKVIRWLLNHPEIKALLIGKEFATVGKRYPDTNLHFFTTVEEATHYLKVLNIKEETLILLKGSRGSALEHLEPLLYNNN